MQKTPIPPALSGPGYERIKDALETILASEKFLSAPQMSAFLRYVVVQAATGNKSRIKAYTVAVDALGKPDSFDPQNDPVVRVLAGRLRSTLSAYYMQHSNADVIIKMKPGSYVPTFVLRDISDNASDGDSDGGSESSEVVAPAADDAGISTPLTADLAQAANNQWEMNRSDDSLDAARILHASCQQANAETSRSSPSHTQNLSDTPSRSVKVSLLGKLHSFPGITAALAFFIAVLFGMQLDDLLNTPEPALMASNWSGDSSGAPQALRPRPDSLSLFVSAMAPESSLASHVNTTMSSVFSESNSIRVYRLLRPAQLKQIWPEDYFMTLDVLPLVDETRLSVQLVDALTGRITHSEILHLSAEASGGLSESDLTIVTDSARRLIREDGPLAVDYQSKTSKQ